MVKPEESFEVRDVPRFHAEVPREKHASAHPIRVLLIHQAFCGPNDPGGTRHYEFARRMVAKNHRFSVVTSNLSYLTGQEVNQNQPRRFESLDGIRVFRAYTYKAQSPSFLRRIVAMVSFAFTSVITALRAESPDVVVGTTPPIFQAVSACVVSALRRKPLLLEVRDLWPDFAIDMGILKNPFAIRMAQWLERVLYRRASHLLVNSPAYRDHLIGKGIGSDRISLIPNGVDPEMFDPDERGEHLRRQFGLNGKFVVTYAGALGIANDIDTVLQAAKLLMQYEPDIHFLLVGDGKERSRLEQKAQLMALDNVTFAGPQPKNQMVEFLAASDAFVAILQDIPMFRTTYPNKVFDYMAAGRPTILAIDGVIRDVVEKGNGGIFVPPGDALALSEAARSLYRNQELCCRMGADARAFVAENFHRDKHATAFLELVIKIAERPNKAAAGLR